MRYINTIFILLSSLYVVISCPNDCNRNGICNSKDECECVAPFIGYDCSLKSCPTGLSWDGNHTEYVECSNRGICNKDEGICECLYGYTGKSCERSECLNTRSRNVCDNHGRCLSMRNYHKKFVDLSKLPAPTTTTTTTTTPSPAPTPTSFNLYNIMINYTDWDADRIFGCLCDPGFKGPSCTERECPYGVVAGRDKWDSTSFIKLDSNGVFSDLEFMIINCKEKDNSNCRYEIFKLKGYMTRSDIRDMIKQNGIVRDVKVYFYNKDDGGDDINKNRVSDLKKDTTPNDDILVIRFVVDPYARVLGYRKYKKGVNDDKFTLIEKVKVDPSDSDYVTPPTPTPAPPLTNVPYFKFSVCDGKTTGCYVEADSSKIYMECSGLGKCQSNGICKCIEAAKPSNINQGYVGDNYEYNYDYGKATGDYNKEDLVYNCRLKGGKYSKVASEIGKKTCNNGIRLAHPSDSDSNKDFTQYPYCQCSDDYDGYDCGESSCELSSATTSLFSLNHQPEICGGKGICSNNECNCIPGYIGGACNQFDCPSENYESTVCNNNGQCVLNSNDGKWDMESIYNCKCNAGYTGPTCRDRLCNYGLISTEGPIKYPSITFTCNNPPTNAIKIKYMREETVESSYTVDKFTDALMKAGLRKPFIFTKDGNLLSGNVCDSSTTIKIEFRYYCGTELNGGPTTYNGKPAGGYTLELSGTGITNPTTPIKATEGDKCYECSNHGICNTSTGKCMCDSRFSSYKYREGDEIVSVKDNCQTKIN